MSKKGIDLLSSQESIYDDMSSYLKSCKSLFCMNGSIVCYDGYKFEPVNKDRLRRELHSIFDFHIQRPKYTENADIPPNIINLVFNDPSFFFQEIETISHNQCYIENNETSRGYNSIIKHFQKSDNIALDDADASFPYCNKLLNSFNFEDNSSRSNALAMMVYSVSRLMISGRSPIILIKSKEPCSGKSTLSQVLSILFTGERSIVLSCPDDEKELDKALFSYLRTCTTLPIIDNVSHPIKSSKLCALVTEGRAYDRILGKSEVTEVRLKSPIVITCNTPTVSSDISRRSLTISLDRVNSEFNPIAYTYDNHIKMKSEIVLMVSRYISSNNNRLKVNSIKSFDSFCSVLGSILEINGFTDFAGNIEKEKSSIESFGEIDVLMRIIANSTDFPLTMTDIYSICKSNGLFLSAIDANTERGSVVKLSKVIRSNIGREIPFNHLDCEYTLKLSESLNTSTGAKMYSVIRSLVSRMTA